MESIKVILGTMTFGPQVDIENSRTIVRRFIEAGHHELDTAYVYNEGETERMLGAILKVFSTDGMIIGTKVNPRITGKLDAEAIQVQFNVSLQRLGLDSVDILYFHFPDPNTPIESALEASAKLHKQGKFTQLGLSNFPEWMVSDIWRLCRERGWPQPTVYQGMYNALSRKVEGELFPTLRKLGMRFYAFNPLAGGLLSGRYSGYNEGPLPGRFTFRPNYRDRYWKESFFTAVHTITERCNDADIELPEAALRWLAYHSCLERSKGDGIIIGVSKRNHLDQNLASLQKGPLPESVVKAFNSAWKETEKDCPDYFRFIPAKKTEQSLPLRDQYGQEPDRPVH